MAVVSRGVERTTRENADITYRERWRWGNKGWRKAARKNNKLRGMPIGITYGMNSPIPDELLGDIREYGGGLGHWGGRAKWYACF